MASRLCCYLKKAVAFLGIGGHGRIFHDVHLIPEDLVHAALAYPEDPHRMGHYLLIGKTPQIRNGTECEHSVALLRRPGDHYHDLPLRFKGAARRCSAGVVKDCAVFREQSLLQVVFRKRHFRMDIVVEPFLFGLIHHKLHSESLCESEFGQIVTGRPEPARSYDDIRSFFCGLNTLSEPLGIVSDDRMVFDIYSDLREHF